MVVDQDSPGRRIGFDHLAQPLQTGYSVEIQEKDSAGYVSKFRIGNTVCSGDEFRDALSLASSAFSIQEESGGLKITTMGKGHGLGMSQWTANELAKNGQNYKEILEFFFEGTTITNSEEILEKPE
jgi:stage II sporulation protein D